VACAPIETCTLPSTPVREWSDDDLAQGILFGHEPCFDVLHERHRGRIYGFALKRLSDPVEAEDVVQEVFLQIHRSLGSYQGRSTLLTWMFGIAHNQVCRRFRRKSAPTISLDDADAIALRSDECPADRRVEARRTLRRCIEAVDSELSEAQRTVFHLKYAENRSTRSIAKGLRKSNQAIKISLFRARRTLVHHVPDAENVVDGEAVLAPARRAQLG
jgi:RNA polymerase sigma-70 factor (ECF subfamily)